MPTVSIFAAAAATLARAFRSPDCLFADMFKEPSKSPVAPVARAALHRVELLALSPASNCEAETLLCSRPLGATGAKGDTKAGERNSADAAPEAMATFAFEGIARASRLAAGYKNGVLALGAINAAESARSKHVAVSYSMLPGCKMLATASLLLLHLTDSLTHQVRRLFTSQPHTGALTEPTVIARAQLFEASAASAQHENW